MGREDGLMDPVETNILLNLHPDLDGPDLVEMFNSLVIYFNS